MDIYEDEIDFISPAPVAMSKVLRVMDVGQVPGPLAQVAVAAGVPVVEAPKPVATLTDDDLDAMILEWGATQRLNDAKMAVIQAEVMIRTTTRKVGSVVVNYSGGRTAYDYAKAAALVPGTVWAENIKVSAPSFDLKAICAAGGVEVPILTSPTPSVSLKLVDA